MIGNLRGLGGVCGKIFKEIYIFIFISGTCYFLGSNSDVKFL